MKIYAEEHSNKFYLCPIGGSIVPPTVVLWSQLLTCLKQKKKLTLWVGLERTTSHLFFSRYGQELIWTNQWSLSKPTIKREWQPKSPIRALRLTNFGRPTFVSDCNSEAKNIQRQLELLQLGILFWKVLFLKNMPELLITQMWTQVDMLSSWENTPLGKYIHMCSLCRRLLALLLRSFPYLYIQHLLLSQGVCYVLGN